MISWQETSIEFRIKRRNPDEFNIAQLWVEIETTLINYNLNRNNIIGLNITTSDLEYTINLLIQKVIEK